MNARLALAATLLLAACSSSPTAATIDASGNWTGTWVLSTGGPTKEWTGGLAQSGSAVTGSILCAFSESYTVSGTNLGNALNLTLAGVSGDTVHFTGALYVLSGVQGAGQFTGGASGCFAGSGSWSGQPM